MPTVKSFTRQIPTQAAPTASRRPYPIAQLETPLQRVVPSAESFGAGLGNAIAQSGERLYADQQEKMDAVRGLQADNELTAATMTLLRDPKTGELNTQGQHAFGAVDRFQDAFKPIAGKIRDGLANDRQKLRFDQVSSAQFNAGVGELNQHIARESRAVDVQENQAKLSNEVQQALWAADNPDPAQVKAGVGLHLKAGDQSYNEFADRNGIGPEEVQKTIATFHTTVHEGIIRKFLANGQDPQARAYYAATKHDILPSQQPGIEEALGQGTLLGDAQRNTEAIWSSETKNPDGTPKEFTLEGLMDRAAEKIKDDPKLLKMVQAELVTKHTIRKQDDQQRQHDAAASLKQFIDATVQNAENAMDKGETLADIQRRPEWPLLPDNARKEILAYKKAAIEGDDPKTDYEHWYMLRRESIDQPEAFVSRALASTSLNKLSHSDFEKVADWQATVANKNAEAQEKVRNVSIDHELFNTLADSAGLKPFAKEKDLTEADKRRLGYLENSVMGAIAEAQTAKGKPLTRDEKRQVMQKEIDAKVMGEHHWYGDEPTLPYGATQSGPSSTGAARVAIRDVSQQNITQAINYMRSMGVIPQAMSKEDVLRNPGFVDRIERSTGAHRAGNVHDEQHILRFGQ